MKRFEKIINILDSIFNLFGIIASYIFFAVGLYQKDVFFVAVSCFLYLISHATEKGDK